MSSLIETILPAEEIECASQPNLPVGENPTFGTAQGGTVDNLSGMESVKVHGTVCNTGNKEAKNVTVTVIFTDTAHDKVVKKTVEGGIDLFTEKEQ